MYNFKALFKKESHFNLTVVKFSSKYTNGKTQEILRFILYRIPKQRKIERREWGKSTNKTNIFSHRNFLTHEAFLDSGKQHRNELPILQREKDSKYLFCFIWGLLFRIYPIKMFPKIIQTLHLCEQDAKLCEFRIVDDLRNCHT